MTVSVNFRVISPSLMCVQYSSANFKSCESPLTLPAPLLSDTVQSQSIFFSRPIRPICTVWQFSHFANSYYARWTTLSVVTSSTLLVLIFAGNYFRGDRNDRISQVYIFANSFSKCCKIPKIA